MTDFTITNHGSVVILTPESEAADNWLSEFVMSDEVLSWGKGIAVEPRYVDGLIEGIHEAGMEVRLS